MSVEAAAHDRVKYLLTIKRNKRSPSREIAAHNPRNAQSPQRHAARFMKNTSTNVESSRSDISCNVAPPDILYNRGLARVQGSESGVAGSGAGEHQ